MTRDVTALTDRSERPAGRRIPSRLAVAAAAAALLLTAACSRPPEPPPAQVDQADGGTLSGYRIATGDRRYELHSRINGTIKPGAAFESPSPPPAAEGQQRDLPFAMDVTVRLATEISPEGDGSRVSMMYDSVEGTISVGGVGQAVTRETLRQVRGAGAEGFSYHLGPDGSVTDLRDADGNPAPARATSGWYGCPKLPPGGADPDQDWKIEEAIPLAGLGGAMVATNGYTLEGDNSAVVKSTIDGPVDTTVDSAALAARFPPLAATLAPIGVSEVRVVGDASASSSCELTWPEQELLAVTSKGRWNLALSTMETPAAAGVLGAGEFLRLTMDTETELRSV